MHVQRPYSLHVHLASPPNWSLDHHLSPVKRQKIMNEHHLRMIDIEAAIYFKIDQIFHYLISPARA